MKTDNQALHNTRSVANHFFLTQGISQLPLHDAFALSQNILQTFTARQRLMNKELNDRFLFTKSVQETLVVLDYTIIGVENKKSKMKQKSPVFGLL